MNYLGLSCNFHDASLSVIDAAGNILFAGHSERYSKIKHDKKLSNDLIYDALNYISDDNIRIDFYERPWLKLLRQMRSGEKLNLKNMRIAHDNTIIKSISKNKINTHNHHLSHAASGFQTSKFEKATVVVIDAIGEFDTITIWSAEYDIKNRAKYKLLWRQTYPNSIGLFYSAMTKRVGLKPLDEEYILMGMSAWGKNTLYEKIYDYSMFDLNKLEFKHNFHIGVNDNFLENENAMDIATSSQNLIEILINRVMEIASEFDYSKNLVYSGGVALNCLANRNLGNYFDNIWIMPNPGDAGSSLGAAALGYGKQINWQTPYLGYDIKGEYPVENLIGELLKSKIVGVANGRAEFGPRALGNRSLLADPRGPDIKDKVNEIKRRQKFRPFAPVILEEYVNDYFDLPIGWKNSRYMQVVARCKFPNLFPAITHIDGTSRVQTVEKNNSGIRKLLEKWYFITGCPMLLNTSLNIRGEPMVNDTNDAKRFEKLYNIKVFS